MMKRRAPRNVNAERQGEAVMGTLMIKCPETGRAISTGIEADRSSFNRMPVFFGRTLCPICRTQHEWFVKAAWVREPKAKVNPPGAGQHAVSGHAKEGSGRRLSP